jgi:hypothetical protein
VIGLPSGERCARFDPDCARDTSLGAREGEPRALEAGLFYDYQALHLAQGVGTTHRIAWGEGWRGP